LHGQILTFSKNEVVVLDKIAKCVLGELGDVRIAFSRHQASEGGQKAESKAFLLHLANLYVILIRSVKLEIK
jgi:hypothetical protein